MKTKIHGGGDGAEGCTCKDTGRIGIGGSTVSHQRW